MRRLLVALAGGLALGFGLKPATKVVWNYLSEKRKERRQRDFAHFQAGVLYLNTVYYHLAEGAANYLTNPPEQSSEFWDPLSIFHNAAEVFFDVGWGREKAHRWRMESTNSSVMERHPEVIIYLDWDFSVVRMSLRSK